MVGLNALLFVWGLGGYRVCVWVLVVLFLVVGDFGWVLILIGCGWFGVYLFGLVTCVLSCVAVDWVGWVFSFGFGLFWLLGLGIGCLNCCGLGVFYAVWLSWPVVV